VREASDSNERLGGDGYGNVGRDRLHARRSAGDGGQNSLADEAANRAVVVVGIACAGDNDLGAMFAIACMFMLVGCMVCAGDVSVRAASAGMMVARRMIVQPPGQHIACGIGAKQEQRDESMRTAAKHESATCGGVIRHFTRESGPKSMQAAVLRPAQCSLPRRAKRVEHGVRLALVMALVPRNDVKDVADS
jgi:hypothetical protein